MDPFLREVTGFEHYVCPGQKEAILSALLMPAGGYRNADYLKVGGVMTILFLPIAVLGVDLLML